MKKLRIIFVLMAAMTAMAAGAQLRYGPLVGVGLTNLKFKQDLAPVHMTVGPQLGLQSELMFPGIGFGLDMGLLYNMGGAKVDLGDRHMWQDMGYGSERLMLHQLQVPLHLRFKYTNLQGTEEVIAPFVYGGPELNFTVAHGKCKAMEFATGDVSLSAGVGAELIRHWQVSASYTWGMTYTLKADVLKDYSARNRQWTLRVAYLF